MESRIKEVLKNNVDPVLAAHYGGAVLTNLVDDVAFVRLTGSCATCPAAQQTIEDVVKQVVMANVEAVRDVVLDNSVSDELLDMARKLMNRG